MKTNNASPYVVNPRREKEIAHHSWQSRLDAETSVERLTYMSRDLVPQANIFIGVEPTTGDRESDVKFHTHNVDEIYCLLDGVTEEIQIEDEKFTVTAPASVFIPAGKGHRCIRTHGTGKTIVVLLQPKYE